MSADPGTAAPSGSGPDEYADYAASERRRALFRVLAANLVRELRTSGYHGSDLLGFVAELMEAITETGLEALPPEGSPVGPGTLDAPDADLEIDEWGRPTIVDSRLVLRPPTEADRPTLECWRADPLVQASLAPGLLDDILGHTSERGASDRVDLIMCDVVTLAPFGAVSLHGIDPDANQAEVGKMIGDPEHRGLGLAGAGTVLLLKYGFGVLGLNRVYLRTLGGNLKNIRLNERIGFRFEGVLRSAAFKDGTPRDVVLMGLLKTEFEALYAVEDSEPVQHETPA